MPRLLTPHDLHFDNGTGVGQMGQPFLGTAIEGRTVSRIDLHAQMDEAILAHGLAHVIAQRLQIVATHFAEEVKGVIAT
ncbi:MAG: hypothetical protein HYR72_11890 [Deltaproteobacteria bacterium]|nr:hypothetical protein [Deltaproteobacteria bacterium]MBI3386736.1 hypothetical protein [Deltaproteobacteria bacterium]